LIATVVFALSFFMVSTIKFRSFKDLRFSWRTAMLVMFAVTTGVVMAVKLHVAFAICWMLTSYVAIGLFETMFSVAKRLRRSADEPSEESFNSGI